MAFPVTLNGTTYTLADFEGLNYVQGFPDALEDFVTHAGAIYNSTSASSVTIGTGSKTFTTADSGKPYVVGTPLRCVSQADTANFMDGTVTSYSGTTLVINVLNTGGSGAHSDWNITIGGGTASVAIDGGTFTGNLNVTGDLTASAFIGDGSQLTNVVAGGVHTATASGTLANGDTVIVNSDGTVSAITGATQSAGSDATYVNNGTRPSSTSVTYDTNENKVVVVYKDDGNSDYGTAIVGSVSGSTITFGTAVAFTSVGIGNPTSAVFDSSNNKVVITYKNGTTGYGESIVGTVSGTSISFGTAVVWNSGPTYSALSVFDSTNNKVVVYSPMTSNIRPHAVVGTVSGTSISFGSIVQVDASVTTDSMSIGFDANAGKVVVSYRDSSTTEVRVGTVSGTSISFGTATVLISGNYAPWVVPIFDSSNNKMVLFYDNQAQSRTEVKVGTVSGTNITFGSAVETGFASLGADGYATGVFDSLRNKVVLAYTLQSPQSRYIVSGTVDGTSVTLDSPLSIGGYIAFLFSGSVFDPDSNQTIISYVDDDTDTGEAFAFTTGFTTLTSENYIGISNAAYADAATATVQIVGSVDDAQSGLTAGQAYYVQNDGSLGTSASAPSVFAGTAVSATELIVKG